MNGGTSNAYGELISHKSYLIDTIKLSIKKEVLTESFLNEKYVTEGLSSSEIARMTFSSRALVTKRLRQFKIPLRASTRRVCRELMEVMSLATDSKMVGALRANQSKG